MVVEYYVKHVYGQPLRYPANPMSVDLFAAFRPGQKTIVDWDLQMGKMLGMEFKEVLMPAEAR